MSNLALGLIELGFTSRIDFFVSDAGAGQQITWLSGQPQPALDVILTAAATAEAKQAAEDARVTGLRADATRLALLQRLKSATPTQISDYVENQVTGTTVQQVTAVKAILKAILLAIALDQRQ